MKAPCSFSSSEKKKKKEGRIEERKKNARKNKVFEIQGKLLAIIC